MAWRMNPKIIISYSNEKSSLRIWPNNFLGKQRLEENHKPRRIHNSTLWMFFCILKVLNAWATIAVDLKVQNRPKHSISHVPSTLLL